MDATSYLWDKSSNALLSETNGINSLYTSEPTTFGRVESDRSESESAFYHFDATGSTRTVTNSAEEDDRNEIYSAFGASIATTGGLKSNLKWVGEYGYYECKKTSVINIRRRDYSTAQVRFNSTDTDRKGKILHEYKYCKNNPNKFADPSGETLYIYGYEGAGAKVNKNAQYMERVYKPLIAKFNNEAERQKKTKAQEMKELKFGKTVEFVRNFQKVHKPIAISTQEKPKLIKRLQNEHKVICDTCYDRVMLMGHSWGGQTVWRILNNLTSPKDGKLKVDAVLTIDPVLQLPVNKVYSVRIPLSQGGKSFCFWENYYQSSDRGSLWPGIKVFGDIVRGADVNKILGERDITSEGGAYHMDIAESMIVKTAFLKIVGALLEKPLPGGFEYSGELRNSNKGQCQKGMKIPNC